MKVSLYKVQCTYRNELGDFHQGTGSVSLHFCSLIKSINPCNDLGPSYFRNVPSLTLIEGRNKVLVKKKINFIIMMMII